MALFYFRWLRKFIRKHTNPIPVDRAATTKQRLSLFYMVIAWNAFGFVCYMVYTGRGDWAKYYGLKSEVEAKMPPGNFFKYMLDIFDSFFLYCSSTVVQYIRNSKCKRV